MPDQKTAFPEFPVFCIRQNDNLFHLKTGCRCISCPLRDRPSRFTEPHDFSVEHGAFLKIFPFCFLQFSYLISCQIRHTDSAGDRGAPRKAFGYPNAMLAKPVTDWEERIIRVLDPHQIP